MSFIFVSCLQVLLHDGVQLEEVAVHAVEAHSILSGVDRYSHHALRKAAR